MQPHFKKLAEHFLEYAASFQYLEEYCVKNLAGYCAEYSAPFPGFDRIQCKVCSTVSKNSSFDFFD
jgi:hypothetical protein